MIYNKLKYWDKMQYAELQLKDFNLAVLTLFKVYYPIIIKWNELKKHGMQEIKFIPTNYGENIYIWFTLKELQVFDKKELAELINNNIY